MSPHTLKKRKELGAYYTPRDLSQTLTDWAIRTPLDKVLEPSFGGCGFLESIVDSLHQVGCKCPLENTFGADIDIQAFSFLLEKIGNTRKAYKRHFLHSDFLKITPRDFSSTAFDVVIGNPPYVSIHNMSEEQKTACFDILKKSQFSTNTIGRNASLWGFFILHSLSFLKEKGRVAWVLPSSLLHADYAKEILNIYKNHFLSVKIIKLYERFFQGAGADEVSVILLAEGFSKEKNKNETPLNYFVSDNADSLKKCIKNTSTNIDGDNYKYGLIDGNCLKTYHSMKESIHSETFNDIAKISIGMVTGHNKTFIINNDIAHKNQLSPNDLKFVASRLSQLNGIVHDKERHEEILNSGQRGLLVCPADISNKGSPVRNYLSSVDRRLRKNNKTFPKRKFWFYPDDHLYPDAFLSYMVHKEPRMVINTAGINCTNSIHRVFFKPHFSVDEQKAIACSMYSSFTQLSCELEGRAYGSGVLKLEPTPAKKISIITDKKVLNRLIQKIDIIDGFIRANKSELAVSLVDSIISEELEVPLSDIYTLSQAVINLRLERYKGLTKTI